MIFKRRERPSFLTRMREFVYPRKGFWRGFGYIGKRMRRLPDTPHRIALGFAAGTFASFTPFFTLHFFLAALIAWMMRANVIAALFGTIVGNPLSFPAIASSALWLGRIVLGRDSEGSDFEAIMDAFASGVKSAWDGVRSWFGIERSPLEGAMVFLNDIFLPYLVGGSLIGLFAGFVSYWTLGSLVAAYQVRRQRKLEQKAEQRRQAAEREQEAYALHDAREGDNA